MRQEFSFRWIIEKFSYRTIWRKKLVSPQFSPEGLGGTSWSLSFNSRALPLSGFESGVCLTRSAHDSGPQSVSLQLEISVTFDGSTILSEECERTFKKGERYEFWSLPNVKKLYEGSNAEDATLDTLCVRCRMGWGSGSVQGVKQCTARTRVGIERVAFLHRVPNFSGLRPDEEKVLRISSQSDGGCAFISTLCVDNINGPEIVCVDIEPSISNYELRQEKLSLIDVSGNIIEIYNVDNRFMSCIQSSFPKKQFFLDKKNEYLPNDELSLLCEYTFSTGVKHGIQETLYDIPVEVYQRKYSIPQDGKDRSAAEELSAQPSASQDMTLNRKTQHSTNKDSKVNVCSASSNGNSTNQMANNDPEERKYNAAEKLLRCPSVQEDFKALYNDQLLTDIVLKTSTESFPSHKNVLCARSSVFRAMLTKDMKEKNTDCIRVDDLDHETVQRLLLFLYSDCLEKLRWESAIRLYYAADKYAVEKLKVLCSAFLVDNIDVSRGIELLRLADTHSDAELKMFAENFILEHDEEIFCSEEWEQLHETNPLLLMKTMQLKYKRKK